MSTLFVQPYDIPNRLAQAVHQHRNERFQSSTHLPIHPELLLNITNFNFEQSIHFYYFTKYQFNDLHTHARIHCLIYFYIYIN